MTNILNAKTGVVHAPRQRELSASLGRRTECAVVVMARSVELTDRPVDCPGCLAVINSAG